MRGIKLTVSLRVRDLLLEPLDLLFQFHFLFWLLHNSFFRRIIFLSIRLDDYLDCKLDNS